METRTRALDGIGLVIEMALEFSLETRVRVLVESHLAAGTPPKMLVMNHDTWKNLMYELEGTTFGTQYAWIPAGDDPVTFFLGVPILVKDYLADMEVIAGV